jgi:hypothetical protein
MLNVEFNIKDLGKCKNIFEIAVSCGLSRTVIISYKGYIESTLQEFKIEECTSVATLAQPGQKLALAQEGDLH